MQFKIGDRVFVRVVHLATEDTAFVGRIVDTHPPGLYTVVGTPTNGGLINEAWIHPEMTIVEEEDI